MTRTGAVVEEVYQVLKRSLAGFVPKVVKFRQLLKAIILTITLTMVRVTANQLRKYQAAGLVPNPPQFLNEQAAGDLPKSVWTRGT